MSLDKAIEHGKEKRKHYYGAQAIDCTCRPHGSCEWCRSNRLYQQLKMEEASRQALEESEEDYSYGQGKKKAKTTTSKMVLVRYR